MDYTPTEWGIIRVTIVGEDARITYRVIAGWQGGYTQGRSWKISSGIESVEFTEDGYIRMPQASGSVYKVHPRCEQLDYYTNGIYESYKEEMETLGHKFELITFEDFYKEWTLNNG